MSAKLKTAINPIYAVDMGGQAVIGLVRRPITNAMHHPLRRTSSDL